MTNPLTTILSAVAHITAVRDAAHAAADEVYDRALRDIIAGAYVASGPDVRTGVYAVYVYDSTGVDREDALDLAAAAVTLLKSLGRHAWYEHVFHEHNDTGDVYAYKVHTTYPTPAGEPS